MPAQAGIQ